MDDDKTMPREGAPRPAHSQAQQADAETNPTQDDDGHDHLHPPHNLQPRPPHQHTPPDTSPALERLAELHAAKLITDEQHQAYTAAFSKLHHAVLRVYGTENALLARV